MRITVIPFMGVGFGEVLRDLFPDGPRFGGARSSFAGHAAMLRADASVVSRVDGDEIGEEAVAALRHQGVATAHLARTRKQAIGTVRVELDGVGRPRHEITRDVARDDISWADDPEGLARRADAVCVGTLA